MAFSPYPTDLASAAARRNRPSRRVSARFAVALGSLLALVGMTCEASDSTQIVVLMDTDYVVPGEVDRLHARVAKVVETDEGEQEIETWSHVFFVANDAGRGPTESALPATFAIQPGEGDLAREVVVELEAIATGSNDVLVSRRVKTGFVGGEARLVRMLLFRFCSGVSCPGEESCGCPGGTTCTNPSCVKQWVSPDQLERIRDPSLLPPDAEFPVVLNGTLDGGVGDGGVGDAGTQPDASLPDAGAPDGGIDGGIDCEPPFTVCDAACVNTQVDPRYCGDCTTSCPSGHVCEEGDCIDPGDCRTNAIGCSGFTFCDAETGDCLRGCTQDVQCTGGHEICDTGAHECVCSFGFERCAFDCVDTQVDPRFCGDCTTSCPSGHVCEAGNCVDPGDCRTNDIGCSGFSYCDDATGDCLFGCDDNAQCTEANQICNMISHDCVCAPGFHPCGGTCASDLDVNTCGGSCSPCPAPPNSTPECNAGVCDFVCDIDYERCGNACCSLCTCEDEGIECGSGPPCNTSLFCGTCDDPMAPLCSGGQCVCGDDYEQNEDPSQAALLTCGDDCSLAALDIQMQGTLERADDYDFYRIEVGHHHNKAVRVTVSGLQNAYQILLTYVCPDGSDRVQDCSGSSRGLYGRTYCVEDFADTLELTQNCGLPSSGIATIIVGMSATGDGFIGPCDAYDMTVSSF